MYDPDYVLVSLYDNKDIQLAFIYVYGGRSIEFILIYKGLPSYYEFQGYKIILVNKPH